LEAVEDEVEPVLIHRSYPLSEVPAAIAHMQDGHARGKIVITVPGSALAA